MPSKTPPPACSAGPASAAAARRRRRGYIITVICIELLGGLRETKQKQIYNYIPARTTIMMQMGLTESWTIIVQLVLPGTASPWDSVVDGSSCS